MAPGDASQAPQVWNQRYLVKNQLPTRSFRGGLAIVGHSMQMTNPLLDLATAPMRKTALLGYLPKGMSLHQEDDHQRLTTDPTTDVCWVISPIGQVSHPRFVAVPSLWARVSLSLRLHPRPL